MHKLARVGVDETFEPRATLVILNLDDMRKSQRTILFSDELQRRGVLVEPPVENALGLRDSIIKRDGWC